MFTALERAWSCASTLRILCNGCPEDVYGGTAPWITILIAALVNSRSDYGLIVFLQIQALRYLRQVAHEDTHSVITGWGRQPAALRALSQKLTRLSSWTAQADSWWLLPWIFLSNSCTFFFTFSEVSMKLSMGLQMMDGLWLKVMVLMMFVSQ